MNICIDTASLPLADQAKLYDELKKRFDPLKGSSPVLPPGTLELVLAKPPAYFLARLTSRVCAILQTHGITTVRALCTQTRQELQQLPHFGLRGLQQVESFMGDWDLQLKV